MNKFFLLATLVLLVLGGNLQAQQVLTEKTTTDGVIRFNDPATTTSVVFSQAYAAPVVISNTGTSFTIGAYAGNAVEILTNTSIDVQGEVTLDATVTGASIILGMITIQQPIFQATESLSNSFNIVKSNSLQFYYTELYTKKDALKYTVYPVTTMIPMTGLQPLTVEIGKNLLTIDITSYTNNGVYCVEIEDDNANRWYLTFQKVL